MNLQLCQELKSVDKNWQNHYLDKLGKFEKKNLYGTTFAVFKLHFFLSRVIRATLLKFKPKGSEGLVELLSTKRLKYPVAYQNERVTRVTVHNE